MKDSEFLILFDFDSLIYNEKNWRIHHYKIGRVGSFISIIEVLNFYRENKNKKNFLLTEFFMPIILDFQVLQKRDIYKLGNINCLSKDQIFEALIKHKIRGRKIQIMTLIDEPYIKEQILKKFVRKTRQFLEEVPWISYWNDLNLGEIKSQDFLRLSKYFFILKNIQKKEDEGKIFIPEHKRIYYYSTDLVMIHQLNKYLIEKFNEYEYRMNAIISYYLFNEI